MNLKNNSNAEQKNRKKTSFPSFYEVNSFYLKNTRNPLKKNTGIILNFHQQVTHGNLGNSPLNFEECFAVKFTNIILEKIQQKKRDVSDKYFFDSQFYEEIVKSTSTKDKELLLIFAKQLVHILNAGDFLDYNDNFIKVLNKGEHIFFKLFSSFWHKTNWQDIFTSDKNLAKNIHKNRSLFVNMLLQYKNPININRFINAFFDEIDSNKTGNLLDISFIDFYLLTWLKHFGIIEYIQNSYFSPILFEVTAKGKKILNIIR